MRSTRRWYAVVRRELRMRARCATPGAVWASRIAYAYAVCDAGTQSCDANCVCVRSLGRCREVMRHMARMDARSGTLMCDSASCDAYSVRTAGRRVLSACRTMRTYASCSTQDAARASRIAHMCAMPDVAVRLCAAKCARLRNTGRLRAVACRIVRVRAHCEPRVLMCLMPLCVSAFRTVVIPNDVDNHGVNINSVDC